MAYDPAEAGKVREAVVTDLAFQVARTVGDFIDNETAVNLEEIRLALTAVFEGWKRTGEDQHAERKAGAN